MAHGSLRWSDAAALCAGRGEAYVLATVLATSGSTPRDAGAKLVVTGAAVHDTLGGGQLEWLVIEEARRLLAEGGAQQRIQHFPLAAAALQCCGGSMTVLFEAFAASTLSVTVFGAGHVGREVVRLLQELQAQVTWLDNRADAAIGGALLCEDPVGWVRGRRPQGHQLILTHDHQLDYELVAALLCAGARSVGLIGSTTKWQRFAARLAQDGFTATDLAMVRCPVGVPDVARKEPLAVALSIVTELLQLEERAAAPQGLSWQQVKSALVPSHKETQ